MAIVNFESVASAAEALQVAGQRPSVRAVIAALGGGSPNSVLKLLGEWKAGRPVVRIADTELDPRITDAIKVQMQRVAEQAAHAAEERAGALDEDLQALAEAQATAEQEIATLTTERDNAQAQAADFVEQLKTAHADAERAAEQSAQVLAVYRALQPMFDSKEMPIGQLELTGRGNWRVRLDSGALIELGRGPEDEVVARAQQFVATLNQVTARYGRTASALESADLRHEQGYAIRLKGVSTLLPTEQALKK